MSSLPVDIFITNDDIFEANESFSLTINSSSLPSRVFVKPDCVLMITITDNDNSELLHLYNTSYRTFVYVCLLILGLVGISVRFHNTIIVLNEDVGIVQPLLVLSNPSSFNETVQVINTDITANGLYMYSIRITL